MCKSELLLEANELLNTDISSLSYEELVEYRNKWTDVVHFHKVRHVNDLIEHREFHEGADGEIEMGPLPEVEGKTYGYLFGAPSWILVDEDLKEVYPLTEDEKGILDRLCEFDFLAECERRYFFGTEHEEYHLLRNFLGHPFTWMTQLSTHSLTCLIRSCLPTCVFPHPCELGAEVFLDRTFGRRNFFEPRFIPFWQIPSKMKNLSLEDDMSDVRSRLDDAYMVGEALRLLGISEWTADLPDYFEKLFKERCQEDIW